MPKGHPSTWPDDVLKKHRTLGTRSRLSHSHSHARSSKATKGKSNTNNNTDWGATTDEDGDPGSGGFSDSDDSAPPPPKSKHRQAVLRSSGLGRSGSLDCFFCGSHDHNKFSPLPTQE